MQSRVQEQIAKHKQGLARAEAAEIKQCELTKVVSEKQQELSRLENEHNNLKDFIKVARPLSETTRRLQEAQARLAEATARLEKREADAKRLEGERDNLEDQYEKLRKDTKNREEEVNLFFANLQ